MIGNYYSNLEKGGKDMRCPKCHAENLEDSLFCNKCGEKLLKDDAEILHQDNESEGGKSNLFKNKKIIIPSTIVLALVIALVLVFLYLNKPMLQFEKNIKDNNYADAMSLYNKEIKGKSDRENDTLLFLKDEISKIQNSFKNKNIDYDKAEIRLETIKNTQLVTGEVNTALNNIKKLNDSRIAFAKAEEFIKKNNYVDGIREYLNVVEEDENFDVAQKQLEKIKGNYKNDILAKSEESANSEDFQTAVTLLKEATSIIPNDSDITAKLAVYEKKLEEITAQERKQKMDELKSKQELEVVGTRIVPDYFEINDQASVSVKNNTQKVIKYFEVGILMYDENGYPLKSGTLAGDDLLFKGKAESVNIQPGETFGNSSAWNLYTDYGTVSEIIACVKRVEYYDGSSWENEYYNYWEEGYLGNPIK